MMSLKQFTTIIISRAGILYRWWPKPKNQTSSNSDGRPELLYIQSLIIPQRVFCLDLPLSLCLSIKASYFLIYTTTVQYNNISPSKIYYYYQAYPYIWWHGEKRNYERRGAEQVAPNAAEFIDGNIPYYILYISTPVDES